MSFTLDPHLERECFTLGRLPLCHVLLMDNAAIPWLILVPETDVYELCDLDPAMHQRLFQEVHLLSRFARRHFPTDKLNVAAIGNIVRQMHLHVISRRRDDYCWPGPVWGTTAPSRYDGAQVETLRLALASELAGAGFE